MRLCLLLPLALAGAILLCLPDRLGAAHPPDPASAVTGEAPGDAAFPTRPYAVTEAREPCLDYTPTRRPLFGDLHVHTARSQDASTQGTRISPREAYQFARGASLGIQPHTEDGKPLRRVQLARPLDFAAVTDHSEQLGEVHICNTPEADGYGSLACRFYRAFPRAAFFIFNGRYSMFGSRWGFCGDEDAVCLDAARTVWSEHQQAAEEAYDRSRGCEFTSVVGYEWTAATRLGGHLHRNVLFRNARVPDLPISVMETGPMAIHLWRRLDETCRDAIGGCEAITIPHNTNWSEGSAFTSALTPDAEITAEETPLRARYDRLVEMMQHKGESECALYPGVNDEGCAFEKAPNPYARGQNTSNAVDFSRDALKRGLVLEQSLGTNPLAFGQIGSTDTHLGTPGLVAERGFPGHGGAGKPGDTVFDEPGLPDVASLNPGGLAVVWAEENARDAIFAAMQRRETYATSGTRPTLRVFGGWSFEPGVCRAPDLAAQGYAEGVPMGGDLPPRPEGAGAPRFVVAASRDPHPNGGDLERIEIVKGWLEDGALHETVITVVGADVKADLDLATCSATGRGHDTLCQVWSDPDFDPGEPAVYYARLREVPSCRWTQWACLDAGVTCEASGEPREGFEFCCGDDVPKTIQERAWSSPIWYAPPSSPASANPGS
jgi:hypothetical protein